jgi:hypothetical protein
MSRNCEPRIKPPAAPGYACQHQGESHVTDQRDVNVRLRFLGWIEPDREQKQRRKDCAPERDDAPALVLEQVPNRAELQRSSSDKGAAYRDLLAG